VAATRRRKSNESKASSALPKLPKVDSKRADELAEHIVAVRRAARASGDTKGSIRSRELLREYVNVVDVPELRRLLSLVSTERDDEMRRLGLWPATR
jgi:hypothetical protein